MIILNQARAIVRELGFTLRQDVDRAEYRLRPVAPRTIKPTTPAIWLTRSKPPDSGTALPSAFSPPTVGIGRAPGRSATPQRKARLIVWCLDRHRQVEPNPSQMT